ncbi:MAG: hypothetical protein SGILL_006831, partial [Bacillariaceae sp.]
LKQSTMAKKKLLAGIGAKGNCLTRYIRPMPHIPVGSEQQRSDIVIQGESDNKKKFIIKVGDDGLLITKRYVKLVEEGNLDNVFDVAAREERERQVKENAEKEPTKWKNSKAKELLYKDLQSGAVALKAGEEPDLSTKEIYLMHPVYSEYRYDLFSGRLSSLRKTLGEHLDRAAQDQESFLNYMTHNPLVSAFTHTHEYIQWQGSEAQRLAIKDVEDGVIETQGYRAAYDERVEYHEFPFKVFRDKIRQEIRTGKYLHQLEVDAEEKKKPKKKKKKKKALVGLWGLGPRVVQNVPPFQQVTPQLVVSQVQSNALVGPSSNIVVPAAVASNTAVKDEPMEEICYPPLPALGNSHATSSFQEELRREQEDLRQQALQYKSEEPPAPAPSPETQRVMSSIDAAASAATEQVHEGQQLLATTSSTATTTSLQLAVENEAEMDDETAQKKRTKSEASDTDFRTLNDRYKKGKEMRERLGL